MLNIVVWIVICYYLEGGEKMIDIAIVDDDINFLKMIKNKLLSDNEELSIKCYQNPYDFINNINNIDYVLLDIELSEINGITLSKQIRDCKISIFFITSHKEMMIKAFGKNVEGFILKDDLDEGINNFLKFIYKQNESKYINIFTNSKEIKLDLDKIVFIKYVLRDVELFLINNEKVVKKNTNLKDIMNQLTENFILINRNTVVNLQYIDDFKNETVYIHNFRFKVSRRKIKSLKIKIIERKLNNAN